jgi:hypothetical protein
MKVNDRVFFKTPQDKFITGTIVRVLESQGVVEVKIDPECIEFLDPEMLEDHLDSDNVTDMIIDFVRPLNGKELNEYDFLKIVTMMNFGFSESE